MWGHRTRREVQIQLGLFIQVTTGNATFVAMQLVHTARAIVDAESLPKES